MKHTSLRIFSRSFLLTSLGLALIGCSGGSSGPEPQSQSAAQNTAPANEHLREQDSHSDEYAPEHVSETKPVAPAASETRSAESHIHGGAVLSIVSEKNALIVELETPLYNLLGFEYEPQSEEEKARNAEVEARLTQPQSLFRFNEQAKCNYDAVTATSVELWPHSDDKHHDDEDGHDDHGDHDNHEAHDDHDDHGDQGSDEDHADHNDVILTYSLQCAAADRLQTVELGLFDYFPNFTALELVYLSASQQMSIDLSPSQPRAALK